MRMKPFADKVAIITGASKGLGREIAIMYAANGANVVVASRSAAELDALVQDITARYGGDHLAVPTDISREENVAALFTSTLAKYEKFDIIVNNAGEAALKRITDIPPQDLARYNHVMADGTAYMYHHGIKHLRRLMADGMVRKPQIVDILSTAAFKDFPDNEIYAALKRYHLGMSRIAQLSEPGIVFIRLFPSNIATGFVSAANAGAETYKAIAGLPKLAPAEIANVLCRLSGEGRPADIYMERLDGGVRIAELEQKHELHDRVDLEKFL